MTYYGTAKPTPPGPPRAAETIEWCEEAGCPKRECLACKTTRSSDEYRRGPA